MTTRVSRRAGSSFAEWGHDVFGDLLVALRTPFVEEHGYGRASRERLARSIELVAGAFGLEASIAPEDVDAGALVEPAASGEGPSSR